MQTGRKARLEHEAADITGRVGDRTGLGWEASRRSQFAASLRRDTIMSHVSAPESESDEEKITPPDGGWGWVVVFASFMIHIITDGVTYTFGIFFVALLKYFNASNGATAWIISILVGVTLCSGPLSSAFVNKYGCRAVTIAGAILASICMISSIFATSIVALYFSIGLGTGLGFGLIYLPAIVSVTCYFEKYRSLATGIAVCGSGLGTFVFSPVTTYLLREYGWKGSMLIIGGLLLNCIIFGIIFRPLEPKKKKAKLLENNHNDLQNSLTKKEKNVLKVDSNLTNNTTDKNNSSSTHHLNVTISNTNSSEKEANGDIQKRPHSVHLFPNAIPLMNGNAGGNVATTNNNSNSNHSNNSSATNRLAVSQPHLVSTSEKKWGSQVLRPTRSGIMYNKNIFYRASLTQLPHNSANRTYSWMNIGKPQEEKALMEKPHNHHVKVQDDFNEESKCCGIPTETADTLKEMLDFSLLKDPIFIVFTISNFCTSLGFNVPYVYIVAQAEHRGLSTDEASKILAVIGIANTVGRIILGYISDKPWINRLWVYNVCLTLCGIATALSAFCCSFVEFSIYGSVFGFTIGAYVGLTSVILVDLLGLERLTNAFGLLLLFQGIASLVGPPIAGFFYDITNSYDPGFYAAGTMIAFSGLMLFIVPTMQRWIERTKKRDQTYPLQFCRSS